jgi:hypothetical protein
LNPQSKAELHQVLLSGNSNFNQLQIFNFPKAALRDIPLSTPCSRSAFSKAASQRGAKGLRAFAQSRLSVGLGLLYIGERVFWQGTLF